MPLVTLDIPDLKCSVPVKICAAIFSRPPPPAPKLTDLIDIVENDQDIDDELEITDAEDQTEKILRLILQKNSV